MARATSKLPVAQGEITPPPKWDVESYNDVVEKAELMGVHAHDIAFQVKPAYFANRDSNKFGYDINCLDVHYEDESGLASADIEAELSIRSGKKDALVLTAKYRVSYSNLEECNEAAVEAFLRRVAKFTTWPYFRTLVATIDAAAGTRLPTLPVLREPVLPAKRKGQKAVGKVDIADVDEIEV